MHRVRYLEAPSEGGWGGSFAKPQRYHQPLGTLNSIYLPRYLLDEEIDWVETALDPMQPIYWVEGELKALAAAKKGLRTVGLGGVDMFTATGRGADGLPLLNEFEWGGRFVNVVYDTDSPEGLKESVRGAAQRAMNWLLRQGAIPQLIVLPYEEGKTGLDDYLLNHTLQDFKYLCERSTLMHGSAKVLLDMAKKYAYIEAIDRFASVEGFSTALMSEKHFDNVSGRKKIEMPTLKSYPGSRSSPATTRFVPTAVTIPEALLAWSGAKRYNELTYAPGEPREVNGNLNMWLGWYCEYKDIPKKLPSRAWAKNFMGEWNWALDNVFKDDMEIMRDFAPKWLLYPLRYPGAKLRTFLLIQSQLQGMGKSFLGHMFARFIYGIDSAKGPAHAWAIAEGGLESAYNPFLYANSFVVGDDIASNDKRSGYAKLMNFVTETTAEINIKHQPQFRIPNHTNFYITTNDARPFPLSNEDRRAAVHVARTSLHGDAVKDRFRALERMFEHEGGAAEMLRFAREDMDFGSFEETTRSPYSAGREELLSNSTGTLEEWLRNIKADPLVLTRSAGVAEEWLSLYELENPREEGRYTTQQFVAFLIKVSAFKIQNNRPFMCPVDANGTVRPDRVTIKNMEQVIRVPRRVWAIADAEKWENLSKQQVELALLTPFNRVGDTTEKASRAKLVVSNTTKKASK